MADKIQVAVRVRPVLFQKKDVEVHWACSKGMVFQIEPSNKKRIGNPYLFDQVFGTETQNLQIFTALVQPLIDSAMNGFNVTVLAYGQTASGKTYTMMGSQKELGIVQLVVERIFTLIEQNPERAFLLRCSYIEIYNETISDLLSSTHQKLKVQELAEGHVIVHNLIETNVNSPEAVLKLMQQGNKQRKVGGTSMNERSSRSHTIFRIIVESVPRDEADRSEAAVIVSHINLVDLAGSEKASQTNATGDRFREGCAINTSLSALSLVIKQLSEGEGFVNFRDSKLTHILRASLGGNARTAIICNVTPTVLDETSSTLKFACSAKAVQNQPHVNEVLSDQALLRKYNNYIKDLEKKLKEKEQEKRPEAIEEMQRLLQEKDMKINELKEQLVVSSSEIGVRPDEHLSSIQRSLRRMTWGGNRLKLLSFPGPAVFESTPLFSRMGSALNHQRISTFSNSEMALDELVGDCDSIESETFLPAEMVFSRMSDSVTKVDAATMTDISPFKLPSSPCTPIPVLRERLNRLTMSLSKKEKENQDLKEELEDLTHFTRLEEQIGVHAKATAKNADSQEAAEKLHKALQTANDMEVLYMDTQHKFSELQTEFRNKEAEHENEISVLRDNFQERLDTEVNEKKSLAKELTELKERFSRLEKDQNEADIHVQVISERHAKREADLRQTLQEAWTQLEVLGQDPAAIKDSVVVKQQLVAVEKELEQMKNRHIEAQAQIDSLTEELRQFKESASAPETDSKDDRMLDDSLSGMCLSDELRDVITSECSFVTRTLPLTRKRPSSILSVALAKMDQSTCILDYVDEEVEPIKKTRLSLGSNPSEELNYGEIKEIREYLVTLQSVLVRYEEDFELLSQEKEALNNQLLSAQSEVANLREEKSKIDSQMPQKEDDKSVKKLDTSEECFDSSCFMGEQSMSASLLDMEQSVESNDHYVSCGSLAQITAEDTDAAALRNQKVDEANRRKQELEEKLSEMDDKISQLQKDVESKTAALEAAQSTIEELQRRDGEREKLVEEDVKLAKEAVVVEKNQLERQLVEVSERVNELTEALQQSSSDLEATRAELRALEQTSTANRVPREDFNALEFEFKVAMEKVSQLEALVEAKTSQLDVSCHNLEAVQTQIQTLETEETSQPSQLESLGCEIEILSATNASLSRQIEQVQSELQVKEEELLNLRSMTARVSQLEAFLEEKTTEFSVSCQNLEIAQTRIQTLETEEATRSSQLESLERNIEILSATNASLSHQIGQVESELNAKVEEFTASCQNLEIAQIRIQTLENEIATRASQLESFECNIEVLSATKAGLSQQIEQMLTELNAKNQELETLRSVTDKVSTLETRLEQSDGELTKLSSIIDEKTDRIRQLEQELLQTKDDLHSRQEDLQQVEQKLLVRQTELEDLRVSLKTLENANDELVAKFSGEKNLNDEALELKWRETTDRVSQLETSLEEKRVEFNISCQNLEVAQTRIQTLEKEEASRLDQLESLERNVQVLSSTNLSLSLQIEQVQSELQEKQEELSNLRSMTEKISTLEDRLEQSDEELTKLSRVIEEKTDRIRQLENELLQTTNGQHSRQEQLQHIEQKLRERQTESENLRTSLESMQNANDGLVNQLMDKNNLIDDLQKNVDSNTQRFDILRSKLDTVQEEKSTLLERTKSLENDLDYQVQVIGNLRDELTTMQNDREKGESSRSSQLESLERKIEVLTSTNVSLGQEIKQVQSESQAKEEELLSNLRSMTEKVSTFGSRLEQSERELSKLSRVIDEKTDQIRQLEEELLRSTDSQHRREEQFQQIEEKLLQRQTELANLRVSLESMQNANDELVAQLSDKENLNGDLRRDLDSTNQRFDRLHCKLEVVESEKSTLLERIRSLENDVDCREKEIGNVRSELSAIQNERELSSKLNQHLSSLKVQYDEATSQCKKLSEIQDELLEHQGRAKQEISVLTSQLQLVTEAKSELEQERLHSEEQKAAILHDYQSLKYSLTETEGRLNLIQSQRDDYFNQVKRLRDQLVEMSNKTPAMESSCKHQPQHHMEETIKTLNRELVDVRSKSEILRLNFLTEEDSRKKKIDRLEKELEHLNRQYMKCKEQFRLSRHQPTEEGTVSLPKHRVSVSTDSSFTQTDPIADKGFGFRWQMEQYVSDNERLRKKVSEVGERMEFYKEKLIKYRNLYFQTTGQDDSQRPTSTSSNSSQPADHGSSTQSNSRENEIESRNVDLERGSKGKYSNTVVTSIIPQPVVATLQEQHRTVVVGVANKVIPPNMPATVTTSSASSSARWPGEKKEPLTKEQLEGINKCNPS